MHRDLKGQTVLLIGPGWLGGPASDALHAAGARVWTLRRQRPDSADHPVPDAPGTTAVFGDIRDVQQQASTPTWQADLPPRIDHLVVSIAPARSLGDTHQSSYPAALESAVTLAGRLACRSILYTSSTGVYGRSDGGWSRESDPLPTGDARQDALRDAERHVLQQQPELPLGRTVLRVAGLYGPGRDPAGRLSTIPHDADDVWCNFAWRDDVVSAVVHLVAAPADAGASRIFNCADGSPMRASSIANALGATQRSASADLPRARSNQRVAVDALIHTGWQPSMPSVLDGLFALGHPVSRTASPSVTHAASHSASHATSHAEPDGVPDGVPGGSAPYGPQTPQIRRFLVRFAGLGAIARRDVAERFDRVVDTAAFRAAEALLGETIARAGREDARDALGGPLLQLVADDRAAPERDDVLAALDPVAEPALAALLALLVADLLPPASFVVLYAPFADVIPYRD